MNTKELRKEIIKYYDTASCWLRGLTRIGRKYVYVYEKVSGNDWLEIKYSMESAYESFINRDGIDFDGLEVLGVRKFRSEGVLG